MVPKRKPGRPPKNPPAQHYPGLTNGVKVPFSSGSIDVGMAREAAVTSRITGNNKREDQPKGEPPVQGSGGGGEGERSLKRVRTEEKPENEQLPTTERGLSTRMQL